MSETRAVCLDAYGTLFVLTPRIGPRVAALTGVDAADASRAVDDAAREIDWAIDWAEPARARETWRAFFENVASRLAVHDPQALVAALESVPFDPSAYAAFPDAGPALRTLRERGLRLGVVSNGDRAVEAILERLELRPLLDEVVVSADVGVGKPDPFAGRRVNDLLELCELVRA